MICFGESEYFRFNYPAGEQSEPPQTPAATRSTSISEVEKSSSSSPSSSTRKSSIKPKSNSFLSSLFDSHHHHKQGSSSSYSSSFSAGEFNESSSSSSSRNESSTRTASTIIQKFAKTGKNISFRENQIKFNSSQSSEFKFNQLFGQKWYKIRIVYFNKPVLMKAKNQCQNWTSYTLAFSISNKIPPDHVGCIFFGSMGT